MKYLSLFSGIGGFEVAIHKIFPDAECIGYSEVKPHAMEVYKHHFPDHKNLGNITTITETKLKEVVEDHGTCDIIFGGFPCTNLSSLAHIAGDDSGLEGEKSSLFYHMMRVIKAVNRIKKSQVHVIFENNFSMTKKNKRLITELIQEEYPDIYLTVLNGSEFGVQTRNRIFWTDFEIDKSGIKCEQKMADVLDPIGSNPSISRKNAQLINKVISASHKRKTLVKAKVAEDREDEYCFVVEKIEDRRRTRWQMGVHSDTGNDDEIPYSYPAGKVRTITTSGNHNILIDRRGHSHGRFTPRMFSFQEVERLFGFTDGYTSMIKFKTKRRDVLGNSVIVCVIEYIFSQLLESYL
jgi:DNA-cytosine methyltransferase